MAVCLWGDTMNHPRADPEEIEIHSNEKVYVGIADAHGLESFRECSGLGKTDFGLSIRATTNRHRHATVYWVVLTPDRVALMETAIEQAREDNDWHKPLLLLKDPDFVENVYPEYEMRRSWDMIPNDSLDPYWSPPEDAGYYETTDAQGNPL